MNSFFRHGALRVAVFVASFAASSASMVAVGALFHSASADRALRDSPQARRAMARCDVVVQRDQRRDCVRSVVAAAHARDGGASMVAAARPPGVSP